MVITTQLGQPSIDHPSSVCLISSNLEHRVELAKVLRTFYKLQVFDNIDTATKALEIHPPSAILIDEETNSQIVSDLRGLFRHHELDHVPLVCTTSPNKAEIARLLELHDPHFLLTKPYTHESLLSALCNQTSQNVEAHWEHLAPTEKKALKRTLSCFNQISNKIINGVPLPYGEVQESCVPLVEAISKNQYKDILQGVHGHDNYSYVHSLRVATFLTLFGYTIGIRGDDLMTLSTGGLLHDIGKQSIPLEVLNKPGQLDSKEWEVMKSHVNCTIEYLKLNADIPKGVITIAAQHHEKIDGSGYPLGLAGAELNDLARMASIVDIFSALTDQRAYKPAMSPEKAISLMTNMGSGLDQNLLNLFKEMLLHAALEIDVI